MYNVKINVSGTVFRAFLSTGIIAKISTALSLIRIQCLQHKLCPGIFENINYEQYIVKTKSI